MPCETNCGLRASRKTATFVNELATLEEARNGCEQLGKTLANNFTRIDYTFLNSCCNTSKKYRIGLIAGGSCSNGDPRTPYNVRNTDLEECVSEGALQLSNPPNGCQTAVINVGGRSPTNLPSSKWASCQKRLPYICQDEMATDQNEFSTRKKTTPTPIVKTTISQISKESANLNHTMLSSIHQLNNISCVSVLKWTLIGGTVGFLVGLILLAVLYCIYKKLSMPTTHKGKENCDCLGKTESNPPKKELRNSVVYYE